MTKETASIIPAARIQQSIYLIRKQKVMLDSDLAVLYGIETKALVRAVKRNIDRFPEDFMFQLTKSEFDNFLRCQNGTSSGAVVDICPMPSQSRMREIRTSDSTRGD